jgi:hypothetical protein
MEGRDKLEILARAYIAHEQACHGYLMMSLPTPPIEAPERIELMCSRCATTVQDLFTRDECQQLGDAGIVTDEDVRQFVATAADTRAQ